MKIKTSFLLIIAYLLLCENIFAQPQMPYKTAYAKADSIIKTLTLDQKIAMTRGYSSFFINGFPEKGMPYIYLSDASAGVHMRNNLHDPKMVKQLEKSTAFPAPIALAATFNKQLAYEYAKSVGEECRAGGVEMLLGPGVNIYRNSQCGRNFEYFGEDPFLTSRIAENYIAGLQSTGTAACMKHFCANNTEFYRRRQNSIVSERALNEIYLPAFLAGINAGTAAIMTSYNRLNGEWAGQSKNVISNIIRQHLAFNGMVMTDWNSVYDFEKVVLSGQNIEMPGTYNFDGITAQQLLEQGKITEKNIDDMIRPTIATCIQFGFYNREKYKTELLSKFSQHAQTACNVEAEAVVLLKNNGILPIQKNKKILLCGKFTDMIPRSAGIGASSAAVDGYDTVSLKMALQQEFSNVVCVENPSVDEIKNADIVIVSTGTIDLESIERSFDLPKTERRRIAQAIDNNANTIVLVNSGSGINMTPFADKAAAILYAWYPGQNGFNAIAKIIGGKINPSGKLPMTIEKSFKDSPAYGDIPKDGRLYDRCINERLIQLYDINYDEDIFVGYRWYEAKGIEPLFPFGFGLSYTTFKFSNEKIENKNSVCKISVTVENTGNYDGAEVVQIYVGEVSPSVARPKKELKAFEKINLKAGEKREITLNLKPIDFAFWNDTTHEWQMNAGDFKIFVGTSSADIKFEKTITFSRGETWPQPLRLQEWWKEI